MPELVPVRVRDCACPDLPHVDGDIVYLAPRLSLAGGIEATTELSGSGGNASALTARLMEIFLRYGVKEANYEPFDVQDLLDDYSLGLAVAEKANELYAEAFLRPLAASRPPTSKRGRTASSTSATPSLIPVSPSSS